MSVLVFDGPSEESARERWEREQRDKAMAKEIAPKPKLSVVNPNRSFDYMHLVSDNYIMSDVLKGTPGWSISGGTTCVPYPRIPKGWRYAIWEMNSGYETHPDYIEWKRLNEQAAVSGIERKHWWAPERDLWMFDHPEAYNARHCPCREHRVESLWDIGWDMEAGEFKRH